MGGLRTPRPVFGTTMRAISKQDILQPEGQDHAIGDLVRGLWDRSSGLKLKGRFYRIQYSYAQIWRRYGHAGETLRRDQESLSAAALRELNEYSVIDVETGNSISWISSSEIMAWPNPEDMPEDVRDWNKVRNPNY